MTAALQHTLTFMRDLRANNSREWFNDHQAAYQAARAAFEDFIADLIARFDAVEDLGGLDLPQAIYRLNRDVRFSADKSPFKPAMSALIGRGRRKAEGRAYYLQIAPGESFVGSGMYMIFPPELEKIRQVIAADSAPLRALLNAPDFKRFFGAMDGEQLKTAPKGYPKDHPDIDLLRYKQFTAIHRLTEEQVIADDLLDHVIEVCLAVKPFTTYLYDLVGERDMEVHFRGRAGVEA